MPSPIIDAHVHTWDFSKAAYTWLDGDTSILNRNYLVEQMEHERIQAGVTAGVLVQAANNVEDTAWMLQVAERNSWIKGVVGWLPLEDSEATQDHLSHAWVHNAYLKGARHLIHNEPDPAWLLQPGVLNSLAVLANHHLTYDLVGVNNAHLETALEVMDKVPELRMVLDHLNQPPIAKKEQFGRWGELMAAAARNPHCFVKISGLGTASGNLTGWQKEDLVPYVAFVLEQFGVDRCFCGGDWPVSLLAGSYPQIWGAYRAILGQLLNEQEQAQVLYHNVVRFYQLSIPSPA